MLVASDFDGTLAPIVADPDAARALPGAVTALERLTRRPDVRVALVSGRALADLRERCRLADCWYVGGHGNETSPADPEAVPHQQLRKQLEALGEQMRQRLGEWPGARLETKPFSLAVHFREAPQWAEAIRQEFSALAGRHVLAGGSAAFRVLLGRQIVELLPAQALTKGHAVQRLRSRLHCDLAFYFGDDTTDEDVFRLHDPHIIGIKVAHGEGRPAPTAAEYGVPGPAAVVEALEAIGQVREAIQKKNLPFSAVPP